MFDVGWSELLVIGVVAIVVVGPKDLPKVLRSAGKMMRKARGLADEFKAGMNDLIEEAELEETKKSIHHVSNFDPADRGEEYGKVKNAEPAPEDPATTDQAAIDPTTGAYVPPSPDGDAETDAAGPETGKPGS